MGLGRNSVDDVKQELSWVSSYRDLRALEAHEI